MAPMAEIGVQAAWRQLTAAELYLRPRVERDMQRQIYSLEPLAQKEQSVV